MLRLLVVQTERYQKAVAEADTAAWTAKSGSGSDAYAPHKEALLKQIGYLTQMTNQLYAHPEKLPLALDVLFRLQSLENATLALAEGAQKYDAVKVFDELHRLMEQNIDLRTQLRDYVMDLSVTKETEYTIAEQEAHRCQAVLNRNPLAPEPKTNPAGKK